jgi:competence protein ComEC
MKYQVTISLKSSCSYATNFSRAMTPERNIIVWILVPFCAGIYVLHDVHFTKLNLLLHITLILNLFLILIFNYLYRSIKVYHHKKKLAIFLYFPFFLFGALCVTTDPDALDSDHFSKKNAEYLKIYVADEPRETAGLLRCKVRIFSTLRKGQKTESCGMLMLSLRPDSGPFHGISYGRVYLIPARFSLIPEPRNPAEFDSKTWMANQHIYHQAFLSFEELVPLHQQRGSLLISFALALRKQQVDLYRKLIRTDEAFAIASTLILGYRAELDAATMDAYSRTGTIHALSVSGMHVAMVYLVLEYALAWMNRKRMLKCLKVIIILTLIWFYALVTGCSSSVIRSAIMLTMLILTRSLHRNSSGYHILALSAFCQLFTDPDLLWDVGFQLSYLAVFGLIYLQPRIYGLVTFRWWPLQQVWNVISVSLAAQLFTWPLSIYYFHQFPVYFLLSNLFITLPVAVLMYAGLAILLFRLYLLAGPFDWLLNFMNRGLAQIASLPYSTIHQIWITQTELILLCTALVLLLKGLCEKKKQLLFYGLSILILFQAMLLRDKAEAHRQMAIIIFSLNRNYAAAFIHSNKAVLLTDLSAQDKVFKFHIQSALDQRKISNTVCFPWDIIHRPGKELKPLKDLQIAGHQLRFRNFRVLFADSCFNRREIQGKHDFDAIWLHGNPSLKLAELRKAVRYHQIWIDATNHNSMISKVAKETLNFNHSILVFKQNKASLVNLK